MVGAEMMIIVPTLVALALGYIIGFRRGYVRGQDACMDVMEPQLERITKAMAAKGIQI